MVPAPSLRADKPAHLFYRRLPPDRRNEMWSFRWFSFRNSSMQNVTAGPSRRRRPETRCAGARLAVELLEDRTVPSVYNVTTKCDDLDGGTLANPSGPDGVLSLREAIMVANLNPGMDTINFNIDSSMQNPD